MKQILGIDSPEEIRDFSLEEATQRYVIYSFLSLKFFKLAYQHSISDFVDSNPDWRNFSRLQ